jgi:hypothetical protein
MMSSPLPMPRDVIALMTMWQPVWQAPLRIVKSSTTPVPRAPALLLVTAAPTR